MRVILRCKRLTPIRNMIATLEWLNISERLFLITMTLIYKILNNLAPSYLSNLITLKKELNTYETRGNSNNNIYVSHVNYKSTMKSLFFKGVVDYNKIPIDIKNSTSVKLFKTKMKKYILEMRNATFIHF